MVRNVALENGEEKRSRDVRGELYNTDGPNKWGLVNV